MDARTAFCDIPCVPIRETIDDIVLGPPVAGRVCGDCVACCRIPEIDAPELKKPAGALCPHCPGSGCAIHETRPIVCRAYFCVWRRIGALREHLRPDRINVMFDLMRDKPAENLLTRLYIRANAYNSWDDFATPEVGEALAVLGRARLPVWLSYGGAMRLAHPAAPIAAVVLHGAGPPRSGSRPKRVSG